MIVLFTKNRDDLTRSPIIARLFSYTPLPIPLETYKCTSNFYKTYHHMLSLSSSDT